MKSQFFTFTVLSIVMFLLSLDVARFSEAQTNTARDNFLRDLNDPDVPSISLGSTTTMRQLVDTSDPTSGFDSFIPDDIDRVITITSTGTTTIRYNSSTATTAETAEDDGVEFYFNIVDGGEIRFSNAAHLSGGYSGTGLFYIMGGKLTFDKTATFSNNKSYSSGGAIYAESYSDQPILTFKDNAVFTSNYVDGDGGAIGLLEGQITVAGDATFTSNTATGEGGALWLVNDSTLSISGTSTFSKNSTAGSDGGAISATGGSLTFGGAFNAEENVSYADGGALNFNNATVTFNGTAIFKKNKAGLDLDLSSSPSVPTPTYGSGGALYLEEGIIDFKDTVTFGGTTAADGNTATTSGGALYAGNYSEITFDKLVTFQNNSVSEGDGGALYLDEGIIKFNADAAFQSNKSAEGYGGGAIYATGTTDSLIFAGTTQFLNNTATNTDPESGGYGGAVYLAMAGDASDTSDPVFALDAKGKIVFSGNSGILGGAIYSDSSSVQFQEIELTNNTATFITPDFTDPDTYGGGGALYVISSSYLVFNGPTTVTGNKAANGAGGAVFAKQNGTVDADNPEYGLVFKNSTTISGNEAQSGGAFFLDADAVSFEGTTTITNNKATNGGAFWLSDSMVSFDGNAEIADNTGTGKGGAFYVAGQSIVRVGNNSTLNIKAGNGTAKNDIYLDEDSVLQFHTDGAKSTLIIASDISSDSNLSPAKILKTGEGSVYIDGDASNFAGHLTIETGDFYIGKTGTFGKIDATELTIEQDGRLVLDVGDAVQSASSQGDARIFLDTINVTGNGDDNDPRILVKALNDSIGTTPEYAFITLNTDDETILQDLIDNKDQLGTYSFLTLDSTIRDNSDQTTTLVVSVTFNSSKDWTFDLPRKTDEFTLNTKLDNSLKPLTVSGQGTLKLNNDNKVAGLNDNPGKDPGNVELLGNHTLTVAGNTNADFSGKITGTGKFIVDGTLTQTLTGTNSYSGGTEIQQGTLTGDSKSLQGNIKVDQSGNLTFNQNNYADREGTFAGQLTGNGTLNIEGKTVTKGAQEDSVLRFTNDSSGFTGATNIKSGWLMLAKDNNQSGNLSGSNISIFSDGGLGGAGIVKSVTVANGGAVQAFEGMLTINENLEYTSGGILYVIVKNDANGAAFNVIDVAGKAILNNVTVDVVGVENYTAGTDYTFLKTVDGIDGTFSNSSDQVTDASGDNWEFTFKQSSDGKNYLTVGTKSDTPKPPDPPAPTPAGLVWNQAQVARTLNTVGEGLTGLPGFIKELNTHKTTDADGNIEYDAIYRDITKQLSGSVRLNGFQLSLYSPYRTVFNRLTLGSELYSGSPIIYNNGYGAVTGLEHRGAGAGATTYRGQYEPLNSHLMDEAATTCDVPYFMGENNFWADVTHLQTKTKGDGNSDGYGISRTGLLIGLDIQRKPTSRVGVLFGYFAPYLWQNSDRVEADDYHAAMYFQKNYYGTDIYGFLGYAHQEYNSRRFLDLTKVDPKYGAERYSGKTSGDTFSMSFELSKPRYYGNNYIFRPLIGLDYIFAAQNGYLDYGTASNLFGLRYDRAVYDQWFFRAGLNLKRETFRSAMNFRLQYINQFG
ncbi:MAG: autotransporter domain-containing protein, partial [Planctomycetaceae bacterium]|nr:autotransporter domain-containing protein [Planctomycetaceae bacterium]